MTNKIVCPFYCKNEDHCDIGCGYISPSDVRMIIQFCSSHHRDCPKYQELAARSPEICATCLDEPLSRELAEAAGPEAICARQVWALDNQPGQPPAGNEPGFNPQREEGTDNQTGRGIELAENKRLSPTAAGNAYTTGPLGLLGFGLTLILLSLSHTGFFPMDTMILGMALFYGGTAQLLAGMMEWRKHNTFGVIAFTSFGLFWLSLVAIIILPGTGFGLPPKPEAISAYLAMWSLFSALLFIGTLRLSRALQLIFSSLTLFFILLAAGEASSIPTLKTIAGYLGIACGLVALYTGTAQIVNEIYGRPVAPLGVIKKA